MSIEHKSKIYWYIHQKTTKLSNYGGNKIVNLRFENGFKRTQMSAKSKFRVRDKSKILEIGMKMDHGLWIIEKMCGFVILIIWTTFPKCLTNQRLALVSFITRFCLKRIFWTSITLTRTTQPSIAAVCITLKLIVITPRVYIFIG